MRRSSNSAGEKSTGQARRATASNSSDPVPGYGRRCTPWLFVLGCVALAAPLLRAGDDQPTREYIRLGGRVIAIENYGITVAAPTRSTIGSLETAALTATGSTGGSTITWSAALRSGTGSAGTFSPTTGASTTYTAPERTDSPVTIDITATAGSARATVALTVNPIVCYMTGQVCPTSLQVGQGGGSGQLKITKAAGWTASVPDADSLGWIHITAVTPGTGGNDGTVSYTVDAATGTRSGRFQVAGQTVTVNQQTTVTVTAPTRAIIGPAETAAFSAAVAGPPDTSVTWSVNPTTYGAISSAGVFTAVAAVTAPHTVTVTATSVDGKQASSTVTVRPVLCATATGPCDAIYVPNSGATGSLIVTKLGPWTATTDSPGWLHFTPATGTNDGTLNYTVDASTTTRDGILAVGSQSITISQYGQAAGLTITPPARTTIGPGETAQFAAAVQGTQYSTIAWSIAPANYGSIDASTGLYTAPAAASVASPQVVTVTASNQTGGSQTPVTATSTITVQPVFWPASDHVTKSGLPQSSPHSVAVTKLGAWTAALSVGSWWVHLVGGTGSPNSIAGNGNATISYYVEAVSDGTARTATLQLGSSQQFTVAQDGNPDCAPNVNLDKTRVSLYPGDSIVLTLTGYTGGNITWTPSTGTITGDGDTVTYTAPINPTTSSATVTATLNYGVCNPVSSTATIYFMTLLQPTTMSVTPATTSVNANAYSNPRFDFGLTSDWYPTGFSLDIAFTTSQASGESPASFVNSCQMALIPSAWSLVLTNDAGDGLVCPEGESPCGEPGGGVPSQVTLSNSRCRLDLYSSTTGVQQSGGRPTNLWLQVHTQFKTAAIGALAVYVRPRWENGQVPSWTQVGTWTVVPEPTMDLTPATASAGARDTVQFTAAVSNAGGPRVNWTLSPQLGTIDSTGLYTAPSQIDTQQTVTVTATSATLPTLSRTATLTLVPASVAVAPATATLRASQTQQFTATVTGPANKAVTWTMNPVSAGTLSPAGLFTAAATINAAGTVTITATSQADTSKSGAATVTLVPSDLLLSGLSLTSGTVLYSATNSITASDVTIGGTAAVTFRAGGTIRLQTGFHATAHQRRRGVPRGDRAMRMEGRSVLRLGTSPHDPKLHPAEAGVARSRQRSTERLLRSDRVGQSARSKPHPLISIRSHENLSEKPFRFRTW